MRTVGLVGLGLALGVPVWAGDIYRWTDAAGGVHYANAPHRQATDGDAVAPGKETSFTPPADAGPSNDQQICPAVEKLQATGGALHTLHAVGDHGPL